MDSTTTSVVAPPAFLQPIVLNGEVVNVPKSILVKEHVFRSVFSDNTWKNVLSEEDQTRLRKLLPPGEQREQDVAVHRLFNLQNIKFGNPLKRFHKSLKRNHLAPENFYYRQLKKKSAHKAYKQRRLQQQTEMLENLLLLRQKYLDEIQVLSETDITEKLNPKWRDIARSTLKEPKSDVDRKARKLYKKTISTVKEYFDDGYDSSSEDDDEDEMSETEIQVMLSKHNRRRLNKEIAPTLDTRGTTIGDVIDRVFNSKTDSDDEYEPPSLAPPSMGAPPSKKSKLKLGNPSTDVKKAKQKSVKEDGPATQSSPRLQTSFVPYPNVLGLLKTVMTSVQPLKEMTNAEICEELNHWQESEVAKLCPWASVILDWASHITDLLTALTDNEENTLLARTPTDNWIWAGEGHDSKQQLQAEWSRILETVPSLALIMGDVGGSKADDDEVPVSVQGDSFQKQESVRFAHPHRCFTYRINGREFVVGPVKGVYEKVAQNSNNKAREHALLINDRPSYVTILTLVRDAAARLPKGEGTRYEICDLLKESQFISDTASDNHINTVVSGALDRLHYEKDPCVKFDSARKNWVYLHGDRTAEELEMLHKAAGAAQKAKKAAKPSKSLQAANAAAAAAASRVAAASRAAAAQAAAFANNASAESERAAQATAVSPQVIKPESLIKAESQMDMDMMNTLISAAGNATLPASVVSQVKPQSKPMMTKPPPSHQMRAVKLEPGDGGGGRLMSLQVTNHGLASLQEKQPQPTRQVERQMSLPNLQATNQQRMFAAGLSNQRVASGGATNQRLATGEATPTFIQASNLPKGAVFYQRIATPQGGQPGGAVMQKVLTGPPNSAASSNATLMHRIVGSPKGGPVQLARLVQTPGGGQKISAVGHPQQQQYTHVHLPGGERVALPIGAMSAANSRSVQIVTASGAGGFVQNKSGNFVQVQNISGVGGANKAMGVARSTSIPHVVRTATTHAAAGSAQQSVSNQMRLAGIQQQLSSGKLVASTNTVSGSKTTSLLTQQAGADGKGGGQVQLVKALISEGRQGSQAYILTTNSSGQTSMLSNKPITAGGAKAGMIARVLQPDGTLSSPPSSAAFNSPGGTAKSILTTVSSTGAVKRNISGGPVIVRQMSTPHTPAATTQGSQGHGSATTAAVRAMMQMSSGEIPKRIEKSELSPTTELDVESDT